MNDIGLSFLDYRIGLYPAIAVAVILLFIEVALLDVNSYFEFKWKQ